jgi:6-phosphofructokinase
MDILQPAPGATKMGHLKRAVRVTGFVIKWGAHLATRAVGVWMLYGMVVIKIQANKIHHNHIKKRERKEKMEEIREYPDDAHLMDIYSFPGY